jgi:hypothetical protein
MKKIVFTLVTTTTTITINHPDNATIDGNTTATTISICPWYQFGEQLS